jgi:hypothetical protein
MSALLPLACILYAVLCSLQHLQLDVGAVVLQSKREEVARFIGALTTLRSLEVVDTHPGSSVWLRNENCIWLRKECYAPLLQLTRLKLPWWVTMEAPPSGAAGASRPWCCGENSMRVWTVAFMFYLATCSGEATRHRLLGVHLTCRLPTCLQPQCGSDTHLYRCCLASLPRCIQMYST